MGSHEESLQTWRNLERFLAQEPDSWVRGWCRQQGIQYSMPARLAYLILAKPQKHDHSVFDPPDVWVFPGPWDPETAWRELLEWRHPKIDLNLLQLAIIMHRPIPARHLWHPVFLREDIYRDSTGRLVNHPLHLIMRLRETFINIENFPMENMREELLCEERTIDLTETRLQRPPCPTAGSECGRDHLGAEAAAVEPPPQHAAWRILKNIWKAILGVYPLPQHAAWKDHPLKNFWKEILECRNVSISCTGSVISFSDCQEIKEVASVCTFLLSKLSGPQARPSTVEIFHKLLDYLHSGVLTSEKYDEFLFSLYKRKIVGHRTERMILSCQLVWALKDTHENMHAGHLSAALYDVSKSGISILKACEYLPRAQMEDLIAYVQGIRDPFFRLHGVGVETLQDLLERRSLRDECVLTIMEAVRGDVRKVWSLSQLPVPLKELFHVPFQELYKELQDESQAQRWPQ